MHNRDLGITEKQDVNKMTQEIHTDCRTTLRHATASYTGTSRTEGPA